MGHAERVGGGREMAKRERREQGKDGSVGEAVDRVFDEVFDHLGPHAVFGEPIRAGKITIVPVAEARLGFGFGGSGRGRQMSKHRGGGRNGGGGGGGRIVPWGYIAIDKKGASFEAFERPQLGRNWSKSVRRIALLAVAAWGVATVVSTTQK